MNYKVTGLWVVLTIYESESCMLLFSEYGICKTT